MTTIEALYQKPNGKINQKNSPSVAEFLNNLLDDEYRLFTKTLNYQWSITGPTLISLHTFLENQCYHLLTVIDDVAKRISVIEGTPLNRISKMNNKNLQNNIRRENHTINVVLLDLLNSSLKIQKDIKFFIKYNSDLMESDPVTGNFLSSLLGNHEKVSWMYESHLA